MFSYANAYYPLSYPTELFAFFPHSESINIITVLYTAQELH